MNDLNDDLLKGVSAIAKWRGDNERRTYYLLEKKLIPGFKIGSVWHARKSTMLTDIERRVEEIERKQGMR